MVKDIYETNYKEIYKSQEGVYTMIKIDNYKEDEISNKINTLLLDILQDKERILTKDIDPKYLSDALGRKKGSTLAVVFPKSTEEVSKILKLAYENNIKVTPRGAGTNLVGSTVPSQNSIVIDLSHMNNILEIDEDNFTATVEAGVVLKDFQEQVLTKGLFYPPDPGEKLATIGGNISTNAGGMRAVKYGVTRDYVLGLELVLANGEVIQVGSKNLKDTSGLALKDIVIGSEGTLAIITKCILKLIPKPEESVSVLLGFGSLKEGSKAVREIIRANLDPTAIEFIDSKVIKLGEEFIKLTFPLKSSASYLLITLDGSAKEISDKLHRLDKVKVDTNVVESLVLEDEKVSEDVWKIRGVIVKAVEAVSHQEPLDIVVPISSIDKFIDYTNELEKQSGMTMVGFGHAGDGNVHLCVLREDRDDKTWEKELDQNLEKLYEKAYSYGGLISGEHGIGVSKKKYLKKFTNHINLDLMKNIKKSFDERQILNPEVSYNSL